MVADNGHWALHEVLAPGLLAGFAARPVVVTLFSLLVLASRAAVAVVPPGGGGDVCAVCLHSSAALICMIIDCDCNVNCL
jgi:hypothetical protein